MGATYSTFSGIPVPDTAANNDVPYWLSQLTAVIDSKLILTASSTADRDSHYFNAPAGVVCVVETGGTALGVYVKTSDVGTSTWATIWTAPVAPTPVDIPLSDGFQATNGKNPVAVYNSNANTWALWGNVGTVNGSAIANGSQIGILPAAVTLSSVQPYYEGATTCSILGTNNPPGVIKFSVSSTGQIFIFMASGVATDWVGFDGIVLPGA